MDKLVSFVESKANQLKFDWQKKYYDLFIEYIHNRNPNNDIRFYFYSLLLNFITKMKLCKTENEYLLFPGFKDVIKESIIDKNLIRIALYVPCDIKSLNKIGLIFIVSSIDAKAYIEDYQKMYPNGYLIVESSARGKSFGNYIANTAVLEVFAYIKNIYPIDINRVHLFGHSSPATTITSLLSRYPDMFTSSLAIAGLIDKSIIMNTKEISIISLCGNLDNNANQNYLEKVEYFNNLPYSINLLVQNMNNASIAIFMRNKTLIDYVLNYKKIKSNIYSYTTNNLYFNSFRNITILEKENYNEYAKIECSLVENRLELNVINVKTIKINDCMNKFIYIYKSGTLIGNFYNDKATVVLRISNHLIDFSNEPKNNIANNLELLNVFLGPMKIYIQSINDDIDIAKSFQNPKILSERSKMIINYPIIEKNNLDFKELKYQNNILINFNIGNYINDYYHYSIINCNDEGFNYLGETYLGDYSIMQILPNLYSQNFFNLFINYNNIKSARKNFFLRYFIIPSDYSLNDSILRKYSLIYYNNKYYYINYPGSKIEEYRHRS